VTTAQQIRVSPQRLREVGSGFKSSSQETEQIVKELRAAAGSLPAEWKGRSGTSFERSFAQCATQMQRYVSLLQKIGTQLDQIAADFERADKAGQQRPSGGDSGGNWFSNVFGGATPDDADAEDGVTVEESVSASVDDPYRMDDFGRIMNQAHPHERSWVDDYNNVMAATLRNPPTLSQLSRSQVVDLVTDFAPGVSNIKDATIALTGYNPVTGEQVEILARVASAVTAVPIAGNALKMPLEIVKVSGKAVARSVAKGAKTALSQLNDLAKEGNWIIQPNARFAYAMAGDVSRAGKAPRLPTPNLGRTGGGPAKPAPPKPEPHVEISKDSVELKAAAVADAKETVERLEKAWKERLKESKALAFAQSSHPKITYIRNRLKATIPRVTIVNGKTIVSYPDVADILADADGIIGTVSAADADAIGYVISSFANDLGNEAKYLSTKTMEPGPAIDFMKDLNALSEQAKDLARKAREAAQGHH
jgi:WXG100 family type VII secretion target